MRLVSIALMSVLVALTTHADIASWSAASGIFPDDGLPYQLVNSATPEVPQLVGNELKITTSSRSENMYYQMSDADIAPQPVTEITFGLQLGSGSSIADYRGYAAVLLTPGTPGVGNVLHMKDGMIFLPSEPQVRGPTAMVDTTSAVHDYRVRIVGHGEGSPVEVYQDGDLILTGAIFDSPSHNGAGIRVGFGETTIYAQGASSWTYFEHNAMTPEPGTALLLGVGVGIITFFRRQR